MPLEHWSNAMALKPPSREPGDGIVVAFSLAVLLIGAAVGAWADSPCDLTLAERFGIYAEEQPVGTLCGSVITFPGGETVEVEDMRAIPETGMVRTSSGGLMVYKPVLDANGLAGGQMVSDEVAWKLIAENAEFALTRFHAQIRAEGGPE